MTPTSPAAAEKQQNDIASDVRLAHWQCCYLQTTQLLAIDWNTLFPTCVSKWLDQYCISAIRWDTQDRNQDGAGKCLLTSNMVHEGQEKQHICFV